MLTDIICDECGHKEVDLTLEQLHKWVGLPCRKCGAVILSEEEYASVAVVNQMSDVLHSLRDTSNDTIKTYTVTAEGLEDYESASANRPIEGPSGNGSTDTNSEE